MNLTDLFPSRFATGADLAGKAYTLTIAGVELEEVHTVPGKSADRKPVLYFKGAQRGFILTRPLAFQIAEVLRSMDTDEWTGKRITIYPQPMMVAGQQRIAVRAKAPTNGDSTPPETLQDEEE